MNIKEQLRYEMPEGWWFAFGEQMCKEIQDEIDGWMEEEYNYFDISVKEKYGELRIYYTIDTETLEEIAEKYEELSKHTCIRCGRPASWMSRGWIAPYCNQCAAEEFDIREKKNPNDSIEWFDIFKAIKKED